MHDRFHREVYSVVVAEKKLAEDILKGDYDEQQFDIYTRKVLRELRMPDIVKQNPITDEITIKEHIQAWRSQKETIASEPTGLHFGHYKAGIENQLAALAGGLLGDFEETGGQSGFRRMAKSLSFLKFWKSQ